MSSTEELHGVTTTTTINSPTHVTAARLPVSSLASLCLETRVDFSWENLSYAVEVVGTDGLKHMRVLLHPMSGTARGGRVLAVMGPSGAGKSTLLNALIGRLQMDTTHVLRGCVFLNDTVFTERYKKLVSFVAQDDIVMGKETPLDALYFSCRVRLGLDHEEALARTEDTLTRLHLQECKHTYLGVPGLIKGVSGGEKKRTNIATELITNPYIMLMDEPSTGLDSVNALRVGELLRGLAHHDNRTVVCTIHSPSSELFAVFDDLLLLAKGYVIYHGPTAEAAAYFASVGYPVPPRTNPSEYFMKLLQLPDEPLSALQCAWLSHLESPLADGNRCVAPVSLTVGQSDVCLDRHVAEKGSSGWTQLHMLTARSWRMYMRDPGATRGRFVMTVFFSLLIGLFFFRVENNVQGVQDRAGVLFLVVVNNIFLPAMNGITSFPPERAVFLTEQSSENYNAWIYALAKNAAELPFQVAFPTLACSTFYFMIHLVWAPSTFFIFWFLLILVANMGYSFGLCVASVFPRAEFSFAFVPMIMLPLLTVGGLFANTARLDPYFIWLRYASFPRYAFVGLFVNEFRSLPELCAASDLSCPFKSGEDVIKLYGFEDHTWYLSAYALIVMMMGCKVIGGFALYVQGRQRRGSLTFAATLHDREMSPRAKGIAQRNARTSTREPLSPIPVA